MSTVRDEELAIAKVYAGSLIQLAQEQSEVDGLLAELRELGKLLEKDESLRNFFESPMVDAEAREPLIERIFRGRASDLLVDGLQILNRKGRIGIVPAVIEAYRLAHEELRGVTDVHVTTAVPIDDDDRRRISEFVKRRTKLDANLVEEVDPSMLGGLIVRIGDEKFDFSISSQLKAVAQSLVRRASREIHRGQTFYEESAAV